MSGTSLGRTCSHCTPGNAGYLRSLVPRPAPDAPRLTPPATLVRIGEFPPVGGRGRGNQAGETGAKHEHGRSPLHPGSRPFGATRDAQALTDILEDNLA